MGLVVGVYHYRLRGPCLINKEFVLTYSQTKALTLIWGMGYGPATLAVDLIVALARHMT